MKKFEKNNRIIALSVLYAKKEKIYPAYVSKHSSNRERQALLNIALIFIVSLAFILLQQQKRESHKKLCENKDFCNVLMSSEDTKILRFNQKSDKVPFVIYADLECLIEKIGECRSNPESSSKTKVRISSTKFFNLQYRHLKVYKISMMYIKVTIV